jgi:hypothetical protein
MNMGKLLRSVLEDYLTAASYSEFDEPGAFKGKETAEKKRQDDMELDLSDEDIFLDLEDVQMRDRK